MNEIEELLIEPIENNSSKLISELDIEKKLNLED